MRSRSGRTFVTLLMFIPLISIPLMAVFGIPEFSLVNRDDPLGFSTNGDTLTNSNLGQPLQLTDEIPEDKPSQPFAKRETTPVSNLQGVDPFQIEEKKPAHAGMKGWAVEGQHFTSVANANFKRTGFQRERSRTRDSNPQSLNDLDSIIDTRTKTGTDKSANQAAPFPHSDTGNRIRIPNSTDHRTRWQSAIGKLRKIGIEDYTLKPGSSPKLFHFSCTYTPTSNVKPRITHRFEAESEDPLQAVVDVIEQIEEWLQQ